MDLDVGPNVHNRARLRDRSIEILTRRDASHALPRELSDVFPVASPDLHWQFLRDQTPRDSLRVHWQEKSVQKQFAIKALFLHIHPPHARSEKFLGIVRKSKWIGNQFQSDRFPQQPMAR